jgi:hypothetical protein
MNWIMSGVTALWGPRYNDKYLRSKLRSMLGRTRLGDTLTNVVIPTFDVRLFQPIIFSTYDVCDPTTNYIFSLLLLV